MIIKAIVTNLDSRKAFDVFNILKNIRIKTVKVCSDGWLRCLLFRIAYSGDVYQNNEVSMVELIANICNKNQKDKFIFFPIFALNIISQFRGNMTIERLIKKEYFLIV